MDEFIKAFALIFVAEMGDKTQILAMAFATKYSMGKVLLGILVGSALNHGLAVLLGSYISNTVSTNIIQVVAGLIFIAFALWTLRLDYQDAKEENQRVKLGPVLTVAIAFFIGELGDKTQLTAITLSVDAQYPWIVLLGTVLGMITTGALGIFVGRKLGDRIPELAVKLVASALFMAFGIGKLTSSLPEEYLNTSNYLTFFAILLLAILLIVRSNRRGLKKNNETALKTRARDLYAYYNKIKNDVNLICLGPENCLVCDGDKCLVGHMKSLLNQCMSEETNKSMGLPVDITHKSFDKEKALESLILTLQVLKENPKGEIYTTVHEIRKHLEMIIFGKSISRITNWTDYQESILKIDDSIASSFLSNSLTDICTEEDANVE